MTIKICVICLSVFNMKIQCLIAYVPTKIKRKRQKCNKLIFFALIAIIQFVCIIVGLICFIRFTNGRIYLL